MKKQSVRERIIETASDLFYTQGYNQTGINQIIAEAGVAKASMYQHFRSKEAIAVEYLVARHYMWMGKLEACASKGKTPKDKVLGCFDYLIEWLTEVDFRGCGWQNIITDLPSEHDKIKDQAIYHKNELRRWLRQKLEEGNLYTTEEAQDLGDQVLILIEGAIILSQIQKNCWPIDAAKKACESLLNYK
ncbi:TetR family transcriptional regulator [Flavobacteriales bacterium 33_180_T64]|nr:TetR family transcriptional regulator [Flavobacteriales bacterium 33_180_T64]